MRWSNLRGPKNIRSGSSVRSLLLTILDSPVRTAGNTQAGVDGHRIPHKTGNGKTGAKALGQEPNGVLGEGIAIINVRVQSFI